ncbi:hypothetical protein HU200_057281 [Digitaria exilis]|uniref:Uncharacterized protein n=1 Tax=Digitaria exilis TaxID=1010633 RepID=A0A835AFM5_9POAL|nr:hypothetical protein HU200_057281 [Digitaria exilis]
MEIKLTSEKITKRAREMISALESEFPAAAISFKCITKEAELMYHWLIPGTATSTSLIATSNKIRQCALSFMTYRKHEYVPAAAAMMDESNGKTSKKQLARNNLENRDKINENKDGIGKQDNHDGRNGMDNGTNGNTRKSILFRSHCKASHLANQGKGGGIECARSLEAEMDERIGSLELEIKVALAKNQELEAEVMAKEEGI